MTGQGGESSVRLRIAELLHLVQERNGVRTEGWEWEWRLLDGRLGIDSLDLAEILAGLERDFGVAPFDHATPETWQALASIIESMRSGSRVDFE